MSAIDRTAADGWVLIATPLPLRSFFAAKHGQRLEQKESLQPIGSDWEAQAEWFIVEWLQLKMGLRRCTGTRLPYYSSHSSSKGDTTLHRTVAYTAQITGVCASESACCSLCLLLPCFPLAADVPLATLLLPACPAQLSVQISVDRFGQKAEHLCSSCALYYACRLLLPGLSVQIVSLFPLNHICVQVVRWSQI